MFGTFSADDHQNEEKMAQWRRMSAPMLDQQIRNAISMIWMALPPGRQTAEEVEKEVRRLVDRALADLREDLTAFGLPQGPTVENNRQSPNSF